MALSNNPPTNNSVPYQIFILATPVIIMIVILICCMKIVLLYFRQTSQTGELHEERRNSDVPSNVSITILRSPVAEIFQQLPPPPSYEQSAKQARDQHHQCQVNRAHTFESTESGPPPTDFQSPPAYGETSSASTNNRTDS